jgi:phospholipase C
VDGFGFPNGTIFDRLNRNKIKWRIYAGDDFPVVAALKGMQLTDVHSYSDFLSDVAQAGYPISYTFIEPDYEALSDYKCGTSQHPLDDVTRGEALIKSTYEAVRNSPVWNTSLLIIAWDEHDGFFEHMAPPGTVAPGDTGFDNKSNQYKFTFEQLGLSARFNVPIQLSRWPVLSVPRGCRFVAEAMRCLEDRDYQGSAGTTTLLG